MRRTWFLGFLVVMATMGIYGHKIRQLTFSRGVAPPTVEAARPPEYTLKDLVVRSARPEPARIFWKIAEEEGFKGPARWLATVWIAWCNPGRDFRALTGTILVPDFQRVRKEIEMIEAQDGFVYSSRGCALETRFQTGDTLEGLAYAAGYRNEPLWPYNLQMGVEEIKMANPRARFRTGELIKIPLAWDDYAGGP